MDIPRRLEDISEASNADNIFAGRCFRIMSRELRINTSNVDASRYLSKVAENAGMNQKTYRAAFDILDVVKKILSHTVRNQRRLQLPLCMVLV